MDEQAFVDFEAPQISESWQPTTDTMAEWALMKIKAAQQRIAHHAAERAAAMAKWDAYVEAAARDAQRDMAFFEAKLQGYLWRLMEAGVLGTKKSYRLPSARLQLRHIEEKWEPSDKDTLRRWADETGMMRVMTEPDLPAIRQLCKDGTEVPGMTLVRQAGEAFSIAWPTEDKDGDA